MWQLDILPYKSEKIITRSREDTEAFRMLEEKTVRVEVDSIQQYAAPLMWKKNLPSLEAPKEDVLSHLRNTEKCQVKDPT